MLDTHYIPALKAKTAELNALRALTYDDRTAITPLLEALPEDLTDPAALAKSIVDSWPSPAPLMIDFSLVEDSAATGDVLRTLADLLSAEVKSVVPVVAATSADVYVTAAIETARAHGRGATIRISPVDAGDPARVAETAADLASRLTLKAGDIDVVLDFGAFAPTQEATIATAVVAVIGRMPRVNDWRSITFLGTAFPESLSGIKAKTIKALPRAEWLVWKRIAEQSPARLPRFGDYGIEHPSLRVFDPKKMTVAAGLRYTIKDGWLVFKGHATKTHGNEQFIAFCERLVQMPEYYSGERFSWGDEQIMAAATGRSGPGNPTIWRAIGTNHHLRFVMESLATLAES